MNAPTPVTGREAAGRRRSPSPSSSSSSSASACRRQRPGRSYARPPRSSALRELRRHTYGRQRRCLCVPFPSSMLSEVQAAAACDRIFFVCNGCTAGPPHIFSARCFFSHLVHGLSAPYALGSQFGFQFPSESRSSHPPFPGDGWKACIYFLRQNISIFKVFNTFFFRF